MSEDNNTIDWSSKKYFSDPSIELFRGLTKLMIIDI